MMDTTWPKDDLSMTKGRTNWREAAPNVLQWEAHPILAVFLPNQRKQSEKPILRDTPQ